VTADGGPTDPAGALQPGDVPERGVLSVLAVDAVGSTRRIETLDPDEAQEILDEVLHRIRGPVERAGGLLVNFYGDGGLAVFGWPGSQEDHADRACEAAWEIQAQAQSAASSEAEARLPLRVAVHTGLVGLRRLDVGRERRLDLVGGTVHLAVKLEKDAEPGEVLVSSQTAELCRGWLALSPRPESLALSGIGAAAGRLEARPHRPAALDLIRRHAAPCTGRDAALDRLTKSIPQGAATAVIGEPGIGKSNLAANVLRRVRDASAKALVAAGDAQRSSTPFAAMRDLLREALSLDADAGAEDLKAALAAAQATPPTVALVEGLWGIAKPPAFAAPLDLARAVIRALREVASPAPRLLLIEDAHLLDRESLLCLRLLREDRTRFPAALILTSRPEGRAAAMQVADEVLELDPLPLEAARDVARTMAGGDLAGPAPSEALIRRADGVPFILQQLLLAPEDAPDDALPLGLQSLVHARLNRISPELKSTAQGLGVLGETAPWDIALEALGGDGETLLGSLRELEKLGVVHPFAGRTIRFRHAIVADACVSTLSSPRKRALHGAAMRAIEARAADLDDWRMALAGHAVGAGEDEAALGHLWEAGLAARRRSASGSLNSIFDDAVECCDRIGPAAEERYVDFVLMAFDSVHQLGELEKLETHLSRALALLRAAKRRDKEALGACLLALIKWFRGSFAEAAELAEGSLKTARSLDSLPLSASAQIGLANGLHGLGRVDEAIEVARAMSEELSGELEGLRLGAAGIPGSIARSFMGWYLVELGRFDEALGWAEDGLRIARREKEPYSEVLALNAQGRALLGAGRLEEAAERFADVQRRSVRNGYDAIMPDVTGYLAMTLAGLRRGAEGLAQIRDCEARGLHLRTGLMEVFVLEVGRAACLRSADEPRAALASIDRAMAVIEGFDAPCLAIMGHDVRTSIAAACGADPGPDRAAADVLRRRFGLHGWPGLADLR